MINKVLFNLRRRFQYLPSCIPLNRNASMLNEAQASPFCSQKKGKIHCVKIFSSTVLLTGQQLNTTRVSSYLNLKHLHERMIHGFEHDKTMPSIAFNEKDVSGIGRLQMNNPSDQDIQLAFESTTPVPHQLIDSCLGFYFTSTPRRAIVSVA